MKITAAVVKEKSAPFVLEEIELGEPRPDELIVRVVATGMCHTDLIMRDQFYPVPLPAVLGHEGAGVVERVGASVRAVQPGDHVVLSFNSCGLCRTCQHGQPAYCREFYAHNFNGSRPDGSATLQQNGRVVHGSFFNQSSFATHAIVGERNVVKVRKDAPLKLLGPLGCGIQTGAGAVLNTLHPHQGSSIAVFGAGAVGLSAIMAARMVGCARIIAVDPLPGRRELAIELGATHAVDPTSSNVHDEILEASPDGVDYALETTGIPSVLRTAVDSLAIGGICGVIGASPLGTEVGLDMNGLLFGRTVRGIVEGDSVPQIFIPQLIDAFMDGHFPFDKLVRFYPFDQINEAGIDSTEGRTVKPILTIGV